jgi:acetoacetyl-CoA reductase
VVTTYSPGNAKAADWLKNMNNMGYGFMAYPCDVTDFDSAKACVEAVTQEVGPVDVLVNNAGITRDMTFKKMTKADWDAVMATNLDSVFNMTKQVMDGMVERKWGRVINVSSVNGRRVPSVRPTIPPPRPACTVSPRPWRLKWPSRA